MNTLEKSVLEQHFPKIKHGSSGRYKQDDKIKVLNFMKEHSNVVQIRSIAEYSKISSGTLVSWRKKFGKYVGISTKNYSTNHNNDTTDNPMAARKTKENNTDRRLKAQVSLSILRALEKGGEFTLDDMTFRVDNLYLNIYEKIPVQPETT